MSETISFRDIKLEAGKLIITPTREDLGKAMTIVRKHKDRLYDLEIKEHRQKRSLDANAMAWVLIGQLSELIRIPPNEVYQGYIPDVGGNFRIIPVRPEEIKAWENDWCKGHIGRMVEDIGPCRSKELAGYHNLKMYIGSSDYDTVQMSRLLDLIIQDCKQVGIETLSERERSLLLEEWSEK